ncbi:translation elongation factor Ts [Flagellatimonas centrodinii]|uniref:translation elongation factor Ts n=1 Tax=Flagellatimonas centrodinii TaxID=2806210 RepID=UPI001FEFA626|nr:translation elongation factor Ts [Flagellatimonas centrodinii]ULQ46115.1 translation elongation factor Ts [Flagellatimonas centrodinii]
MTITAALVKELRDRTSAGMSDCKKALEATGGDLDKAAEKLRMDGMAKADKKGARVAAEGVIALASGDDAIALVELNSETDFVSKGDDFKAFAQQVADLALKHRPADLEALLKLDAGNGSLDEQRRGMVARIGENISVRRFAVVAKSGGDIAHYMHGAKIGVVVAMKQGSAEVARDVAMHIAASSPRFLDADAVPEDVLAAERKIIEAQSAEQAAGKPAEIVAKMMDGKIRKFVAEITLTGQPFVKNPDQTVAQLLKAHDAEVASFVRFAVGEGIEKEVTNFADEVAAQAGL